MKSTQNIDEQIYEPEERALFSFQVLIQRVNSDIYTNQDLKANKIEVLEQWIITNLQWQNNIRFRTEYNAERSIFFSIYSEVLFKETIEQREEGPNLNQEYSNLTFNLFI